MTKIKLKSVIEFLFWVVLFVLALAYFNKSWNISFYFIIGALLLVLIIIEIILNLEHRYKSKIKKRKKTKKEHMKENKKVFLKELTSLFSFIVVLIVIFSLIIQKKRFIEFLSIKPYHLYFMLALVVVALIILVIQFIGHRKTKKKKQKIKIFKRIQKVKSEKKIKKKHIKYDKKKFHKELTSLFSFIVVLIVVFSLIIQKKKFLEFLSSKPPYLYFLGILVFIALIVMIFQFVGQVINKKIRFKLGIKIKYDILFLFGLIVVIIAYVFKNWITALLGLTLMILSLVVYYFVDKKITLMKEVGPKKIISKKVQKDQKLRLLLESPAGVLTKIKKEEERAKQEAQIEKLKLKELQRKIREEEKRKKREEKSGKRGEKLKRAKEIAKQKRIEVEKKKLEKIRKSKEEILKKEKKLGKFQKNREEIEKIIKTKKGLEPKAKYETDFDVLLALINKYERLKISDVAKIFGISIKKAEAWATILEQHDLLEIHYPAIGEPELKIKK